MDFIALKAEIQTDPLALGYASRAGDNYGLANMLNEIRPSIDIERGLIPAYEIINATTSADWGALTATERQRYQTITGAGDVDVRNPNVRSQFAAMFGPTTTTRTNLVAIQNRKGSRAEQLGLGQVTALDVMTALQRT